MEFGLQSYDMLLCSCYKTTHFEEKSVCLAINYPVFLLTLFKIRTFFVAWSDFMYRILATLCWFIFLVISLLIYIWISKLVCLSNIMPYFEFSSNQTSNNSTSSEEPNFELSMVFTVLSFLCILFVVLVLVLASCITTRPIRMKELFKKRHFITGTFSFACLVSVFQMLSYHTTAEKLINSITRILIEVLGTVLMFTGTSFFVLPADDGSHRGSRLNHKDPYFGAFILCMAFCSRRELCCFSRER